MLPYFWNASRRKSNLYEAAAEVRRFESLLLSERLSIREEVCRITVSGFKLAAAPVQGGVYVPVNVTDAEGYAPYLSIHPASFSAASFLFSLRSLSNAPSAISLLGTFTVVSILFQFIVFMSFPLSFAARTPKGKSRILWLKQNAEL